MKRFFFLFVALVASTWIWAGNIFEVNGIAYYKLGGDSVDVTSKSTRYSGAIIIPATVAYNSTTYRVVSIGWEAFADCTSLTSITIPNSVTNIGSDAFNGCSSLNSITIPNSVTFIGDRVFYGCNSLTSINVATTNTHYASIDGVLFNYAKDILIQYPIGNTRTSYAIPNSVTSIEAKAFLYCTSLTTVTIPNSVTSIGDYAFLDCTSLTSVIIGNSVIRIGKWAFYECTSLSSVTIGNSVTSIGDRAFVYCTSLSSITIPSSVTSIGECAFAECSSLSFIYVDVANKYYASIDGVLFNNSKDTLIQYPIGNTRTTYTIPNSVIRIGDYVFGGCTSLSSITIPNNVTSIGYGAFSGVNNIFYSGTATYTFDDLYWGAKCMNGYVEGWFVYTDATKTTLAGCSSAANGSINIPNSVTSIGIGAFYECYSLSSITCYATVPPICNEYCFDGVFTSIPLYVPAGSIDAYKAADGWKEFSNILPISAETVTDPVTTVITKPADNAVTITWPTNPSADIYTIEIKKNGVTFCTLTFNAQGQLVNIAFAPGRGTSNDIAMAEAVAGGYKFTITSLEPGTTYTYSIVTKNASGTTLKTYTGTFTTTSLTALPETSSPSCENQSKATKLLRNGQLLILRDGRTYTATGLEM